MIETLCFLSPLWEGPCHLFPGSSCLSAHVRSQSSISRCWRIKSGPKDSLCGCVTRHSCLHTSHVGWQGPWLGRASCSDLLQSWCCSFPGIWHPLAVWLGTPVSPSHCLPWAWPQRPPVPSVGSTGEGHHRLAGSDYVFPCAFNKCDPKFCTFSSMKPSCRCHSLQHEASLLGSTWINLSRSFHNPCLVAILSPTPDQTTVFVFSLSPTNLPVSAQGTLDALLQLET